MGILNNLTKEQENVENEILSFIKTHFFESNKNIETDLKKLHKQKLKLMVLKQMKK